MNTYPTMHRVIGGVLFAVLSVRQQRGGFWVVKVSDTGREFVADLRRWWSTPEQAEAHARREKARAGA